MDLTRKWKPAKNERGWPFSIWMSEFIVRRYRADSYFGPNPNDPTMTLSLPAETMMDYGFYTQYLYGFTPKWACGLRYEYVWASNYSLNSQYVEESHNEDPFRDDRHRVSPLLAWYLTEFSRFDFQYNFDYAQHLPSKYAAFLLAGGRVHARFAPGPQVLEVYDNATTEFPVSSLETASESRGLRQKMLKI